MKYLGYKKIGIILSMLILGFFFNNVVYAQLGVITPTETLTDTVFNMLGAGLKLLYLITLPVLVIAGKAMDNSMIYGEFINLDKPLYMLRNLSRTFANFAIGGVILRKIVQYIFNFNDNKSPAFLKSLIIKSIGIILGINFSWFVLGALIDLSTIATYSLGAMPLSILKETNNKDMPILSVGSYFDYQSKKSKEQQGVKNYIAPHNYYQRGDIYIPRCGENGELYKGIITGPEYFPTIPNKPDIKFNTFGDGRQYCALNTQTLADITDMEKLKKTYFNNIDNEQINILMKQTVDYITTNTGSCADLVVTSYSGTTQQIPITITVKQLEMLIPTLKIGDGQIPKKKVCSGLNITRNAHTENNRQAAFISGPGGQEPYSSQNGLTMNTLINRSQGMVGPFITLYMSLLDFSNLSIQDTENKTAATTLNGVTEFLLKSAISVALFIPLVALALTLIIRIVILRGVIAFIPLGIVFYGLKDEVKIPGSGMKIGGEEVNGGSILGLIFAPILPVFAISISIIILQTLQLAMKQSTVEDNKTWDFLGIEFFTDTAQNQNTTCMNFWGLQTTCLDKGTEISGGSGFANFLPWLFVNIFAIGLMWMMVKVALSGSKLTSKIGGDIMDLGSKALGAIPLINIGGKGVGASALSNIPDKIYNTGDKQIEQYIRSQDSELGKKLGFDAEIPTSPNTSTKSSGATFSVSNKDKVSENIIKGFEGKKINNFEDIRSTVSDAIKTGESEEASTKFSTLSYSDQAIFTAEQIQEITKQKGVLNEKSSKSNSEDEKIKIKTQVTSIDSTIGKVLLPTIEQGYTDFVDNNGIKKDKINEFIQYINHDKILNLLKDENSSKINEMREKIETEFGTQIEYKNGKFEAKEIK